MERVGLVALCLRLIDYSPLFGEARKSVGQPGRGVYCALAGSARRPRASELCAVSQRTCRSSRPEAWHPASATTEANDYVFERVAEAELAAGLTYAGLVKKMAQIGVDEKEANVRNKFSRGKFTAAFLLQCLSAIGSSSLHLE